MAAVAAGDLDPAVGQRAQTVLDSVARPGRLVDLIELVGADPAAVGRGGPGVLQPLLALDHEVPATGTAEAAQALVTRVTDAGRRGEFTDAFTRAALPLLQRLSDPAPYDALRTLLVTTERDPEAVGPAGTQVRTSLRKISSLPVADQASPARDLLALVQQDGTVTPAFRDDAVAALTPLVR